MLIWTTLLLAGLVTIDKKFEVAFAHYELLGSNDDGSKFAMRLVGGCGNNPDEEGETPNAKSECNYPRTSGRCTSSVSLFTCVVDGACHRYPVYEKFSCTSFDKAKENLARAKTAIAERGITLDTALQLPLLQNGSAKIPATVFESLGLTTEVSATVRNFRSADADAVDNPYALSFSAKGLGSLQIPQMGINCEQLCYPGLRTIFVSSNQKLILAHAILGYTEVVIAEKTETIARTLLAKRKR